MDLIERKKILRILDRNFEISKMFKLKKIIKKPGKFFVIYLLALFYKFFPNTKLTFFIKSKTVWDDILNIILPTYSDIFALGFFEYKLTKFLLKNLKEDEVFIDIGAHLGYYSLLASRLVGEKGRVIAFEPTPSIFKILEKNTRNKSNIIAKQKALFNKINRIKFIDYGLRDSVLNTWKKRTVDFLKNKGEEISVEAITLDMFCNENNIRPHFIKLDTEGSESLVLEGMSNILENIKPILSIEVGGGKEWAENNKKSIGLLLKYNYNPYEINEDGELTEHKIRQEYVYENLIFIPKK